MSTTALNSKKKKTLVPQLRFQEFDGQWENKKLSDVTSYVDYRGRAPIKTDNGHFLVTAKNIKKGFIDYECSKEYVAENDYSNVMSKGLPEIGDILFTTEAPMGNVALVDRANIALAQRVIKFRGKEMLSNFYLLHYMLSNIFQSDISKKAIGTTVQGISGKELHRIKISFPTLPEQQKIASFLSAVDEKIQQLSRKKELLSQYKKGVMQQLFSGKLRFKNENGKDYADWEEKKLGEIARIAMGQSPDSKSYNTDSYGILLIQGNADIKDRITIPRQWTSEPTKTCEIGDLILTVRAPVGSIAKSLHNACIGRGVCSITNNKNSIQEYLYQFFLSYESKWIGLEQGSTFTAVSGSDIKGLKLNLPSIQEQQKIANFLSSIDTKIESTNQQINQTQSFKKGLLQQMFV